MVNIYGIFWACLSGGGCGEDGGVEGGEAGVVAVGVVGGVDDAVAEDVVLRGVCAGESERGGCG